MGKILKFRLNSFWAVCVCSLALSALTLVGPELVLSTMLGWLPRPLLTGIRLVAGVSVLSAALPLSFLALNSLRRIDQAVDSINQLVKYDFLTQAFSRAHFMGLAEEKRAAGGYLILADVDHFKKVNDTYGHDVGDEALKYISGVLQQVVGGQGLVARMGGEEFGILLPEVGKAQTALLAAMIGTKLRCGGLTFRGFRLQPTISLGIARLSAERGLNETLRAADESLYAAKHEGRDRYVFEALDEAQSLAA